MSILIRRKLTTLLAAAGFAMAAATGVAGAASEPLVSTMEAYTVELNSDGQEVFTQAEKALPKQVIEYRLKYQNNGEEPLNSLAITGPIPQSTSYIADSAATMARANFVVSIDDGNTWEREPVIRERRNANGEVEQVIIPPAQYTHVRWKAASPLRAKSEQEYRYRVRIQ